MVKMKADDFEEIDWELIDFDSVKQRNQSKYDTEKIFEYLEYLKKSGAKIPVVKAKTVMELLGIRNYTYANVILMKLCVEEKLVRIAVRNKKAYFYTAPKYIPEKIRNQVLKTSLEAMMSWKRLTPSQREKLLRRISEL